ncbi:ABC transporter permease [Thermotoga sp. Ku-13t]|uniref:carbohydrate ABC transporter permease n=1 Tax=Thermotoga sp. Ku-13t TaxID=1755813 RepID=UPI0013EC0892|nr:sugar ABC transporter permease [Thermotoga sp. Ku-13t]KAF2958387.1 ABC transporter permease [Thermotoga sp. Ku-13t]
MRARAKYVVFFLLPAFTLIAVFVVYPVVRTVTLSFFDESGKFVGFVNYVRVLSSREIINVEGFQRGFPLGALVHNLLWVAIHLPVTLLLGLLLAVLLKNVRGGSIIKSIIFLGMVMPMIVGGVMINFIFDRNLGIFNAFIKLFGIQPKTWTAHPDTALLSLIFGSVWLWTGFSTVLYSAGLETIPKDLYEAAQLDGASPFKIFTKITVPMLKPITIVVITMTLLWELKVFDIVYVATMGGPGGASNVLALQMYLYAFRAMDFNRSAVVAVLMTASTLLVSLPLLRTLKEDQT